MKKFLSLMLAMIMVMSLVTVGAGAAFTDAEDIQYTEAVDLMTGLGILQGPGDGTFNPKGNLSRAAAAKIIAYIALGAEAADKMTYDEVIFPDVPTTSSTAPYIAWCAEQGIINGYKDGTFGRQNTVSGHAFLKMVLGAVGVYGQYTGTGWQTIVTATAKENKLLEGLADDVVLSQPLTREAASQIAFNAMKFNKTAVKGYLVEGTLFDTLVEAATYINLMKLDVAPKYVFVEGGKLLETVHGTKEVTGVIIENQTTGSKTTKVAPVVVEDGKVTEIGTAAEYNVKTGLSDLGKVVTVYFTKTGEKGAVKSISEKSKTITVTKAITKAEDMEKTFGEDIKVAAEVINFADYTDTKAESIPGFDAAAKAAKGTYVLYKGAIVSYVAPAAKTLAKVVKVDNTEDKETIELSGYGKLDNGKLDDDKKAVDVVVEYDGIAKDDYVVVTKVGALYNLEKAATETGKLTKINGTKVTVNGKEYDQAGTDKAGFEALTLNFTTEYVLYLDGQGNYIAIGTVKEAEAEKQTVYFVAAYTKTTEKVDEFTGSKTYKDTYFAQCVDTDGKEVIFQTKALEDKMAKGVYEVTLTTEKKVDYATFKNVGYDTTTDVKADDIKVDGVYYFADDVKFIAVEDSLADLETTVKTGVQDVTKDMSLIYKAVKDSSNNTVSVVFVDGAFEKAAPETVKDVVYAVEKDASTAMVPYADKDNKTQTGYEHTVYVDGVKTTIITDKADALKGFITLTKNGAGYTTAAKTATNLYDSVKVTSTYKTLITVAGTDLTDIDAADAEIIDLRKVDEKVTSADKLADLTVSIVADKSGSKTTIATIYVIG